MPVEISPSQEPELQTPVDKILTQYEKMRANNGVLPALGELRVSLKTLDEIPYLGRVEILEKKAYKELIIVDEDDPSNSGLKLELTKLLETCRDIKTTYQKEQSEKDETRKMIRQTIKKDKKRFGLS